MMESLQAANPADDDLQYKLWNAKMGLAKSLGSPAVPNLGDWNAAMEMMKSCEPLIVRLAEDHPSDLNYKQAVGAQYNAYGQMFAVAGKPQVALDNYRKALQIDQQIVAADPANAFYRRELAIQFGNVGGTLLSLNEKVGALENFKQAVAIYESMIAADPNDSSGLRNAAVGYRNVASALVSSDPAAALNNFQKALEIFARLVTKDPNNADFRRQQAQTYLQISEFEMERNDIDKAIFNATEGIKIGEALTKSSPTNVSARGTLAKLYSQSGAAHAALAARTLKKSDWRAAKEAYQKSFDTYQEMKSKGTLNAADANKTGEIAAQIAKCDEILNR